MVAVAFLVTNSALLRRHGCSGFPFADEEPVLAVLTAPSVRGLIATGARSGQRLRRALQDPATGVRTAPLCFASRGFSLHAAKPVEESVAVDGDTSAPSCAHRLGWAALLARVLGADLSACTACGGRLTIIAVLTNSASIRTYLEGIGLPVVPPPRAPPQPQFEFVA